MQKPYRVLYCVLEWGPLLRCLGEDCEAPEPGLRPPRRPPLTHGALAGTPPHRPCRMRLLGSRCGLCPRGCGRGCRRERWRLGGVRRRGGVGAEHVS